METCEIRVYFHKCDIWLPINIMGDELRSQSWNFVMLILIYRVDQELHTLKSSQFKFGLSSEFSDFFEKIPVRISFNVLFRVFRFSKAS